MEAEIIAVILSFLKRDHKRFPLFTLTFLSVIIVLERPRTVKNVSLLESQSRYKL